MEREMNDFVLKSKGHCFLCVNKICPVNRHGLETAAVPVTKYSSLHYLSRYLEMDMRKVFNDKEQIPPHLLAKVDSSRLQVELCEECVCLIDQFTENYRKLEKAEMELGSCLKLINAKLLDANKASKGEDVKMSTNSEPHLKLGRGEEMEVLEAFREEAIQKSHIKLHAVMPRVKVRNLTRKEMRTEELKSQAYNDAIEEQNVTLSSSITVGDTSKSQLDTIDIKMEVETTDANLLPDDGNSSSDGPNLDEEAMTDDDAESTIVKVEEDNVVIRKGPIKHSFSNRGTKVQPKRRTEVGVPLSNINPETRKFTCELCPMEFSTKAGFQKHYKCVHLKIRFKCETCGKQFSSRCECDRHQNRAHRDVRFKCVTCGKEFSERGNLKRHERAVHLGIKYPCQVCNRLFTQTFHLREHQETSECGKTLGLHT